MGLTYPPRIQPVVHIADGTAVGGNARGANAVDLQTSRAAATQVASGPNATITGGLNNVSSGQGTTAGGWVNSATNFFATAFGANSIASGIGSVVLGQSCTADGAGSVAMGQYATPRGQYGKKAFCSGFIAAGGDAQICEMVLRRQTTDATLTRLTADGAAAGTGNSLNLPNFGVFGGRLIVIAKQAGSTASAVWRVDVAAVRGSGVGSVVLLDGTSAAIAPNASNGTVTGWALTIAADTTNGGIAVSGTGAAATTINWVARFMDVEVVTAT